MKEKIGIIGFGNMGSSIAQRIKTHYTVSVFDKDKTKTKNLKKIAVEKSIEDLAGQADAVILAIKPQDFEVALAKIKSYAKEKLVISIAAGRTTTYIQKRLGRARVVRVMPNLPAQIGKGMIYLSKGKFASKSDLFFVKKIFEFMGRTLIIKEDMMNAATGVSGSGPGFLFALLEKKPKKEWGQYCNRYFIPQLRKAAVSAGFSPAQANLSAVTTVKGSLELLNKSYSLPGVLCSKVASKGGTTEAGLKVLHKKGLNAAVEAAVKRATELLRS